MNPQLDLYSNIGEIRDALDTLLKRGKPASVADLQALVASVEAKSQPTIQLPAGEVAKQLVPQLLPLLPTPATLAQAGQQAATRIEAAIKAGTQASTQQVAASVQESTRQLTAAAAALTKAAESVPRSVPVDFLQGWRWPTGLVLVPMALLLLGLWLGGAFSGVAQAKYDQLHQEKQALTQANQKLLAEGRYYFDQVQQYRKKFPKAAPYFPKYVAPATPVPAAE
jgi:cell division protein FtsB